MRQIYKHTDGTLFTHIRDFGPWLVLKSHDTGNEIHVSPEFKRFYTPVSVH
jgi:hypothetical protein